VNTLNTGASTAAAPTACPASVAKYAHGASVKMKREGSLMKLHHEIFLVTGGNSGIGRALSVQGAPDHIRGNDVSP
jgi:hypothetical protein